MEKFYLEEPSLARKQDVIDYMLEQKNANSNANGAGFFHRIMGGKTFETCLEETIKLADKDYAYSIGFSPSKTFFLIRESDNKLIGMINIRHDLNEELAKYGGHIGFGIRPTERRKGYNKINLYLGLIKAREEFDLKKVMIGCAVDNLGSDKTIQALGGVLERSELNTKEGIIANYYWIDIDKSIDDYRDIYSQYLSDDKSKNLM